MISVVNPAKCIDQVEDIFLQKILHGPEGIGIGCGIKIKRPAEEMPGRIAQEKLAGRSGIATYPEENA